MGHQLPSLSNSLTVFTAVLALTIASRSVDASDPAHNGATGNDSGHGHEPHGVTVAHLRFPYVEQPLILAIFCILIALIKIGMSSDKSVHCCPFLLITLVLQVEKSIQVVCACACVSVCVWCQIYKTS